MKAAKARVDAALEPLTIQEAGFLHKHKDIIDLFTSRSMLGLISIAVSGAVLYFR